MNKAFALSIPIFGVASILAAWQFLLPLTGVPGYIAPTPTQVFRCLLDRRI